MDARYNCFSHENVCFKCESFFSCFHFFISVKESSWWLRGKREYSRNVEHKKRKNEEWVKKKNNQRQGKIECFPTFSHPFVTFSNENPFLTCFICLILSRSACLHLRFNPQTTKREKRQTKAEREKQTNIKCLRKRRGGCLLQWGCGGFSAYFFIVYYYYYLFLLPQAPVSTYTFIIIKQ